MKVFNEEEYLNIAWKIKKYLAEKTNVFGNETKKKDKHKKEQKRFETRIYTRLMSKKC